MARYIDADKLIGHLKDEIEGCKPTFGSRANGKSVAYGTILGLKSAISFAATLPTEDVVPTSMVDELKQYCSNREEEVKRLHRELADMLTSEQTELHIPMEYAVRVRVKHPVYKAIKSEVAREIFEEIKVRSMYDFPKMYYTISRMALDELEIKYTEGIDEKGSN